MSDKPKCAKCEIVMTPENSRAHPEYFLCNKCLPPELKPVESPEMKSPALAFIRKYADKVPFGTVRGINKLAYSLWPAVAEMMEEYAAEVLSRAGVTP